MTQPATFSPDGTMIYATTNNPEPDGCRLHALDAQTGDVLWCRTYHPHIKIMVQWKRMKEGHLYFTVEDKVVSLTQDGTDRWEISLSPPHIEKDLAWGLHLTPDQPYRNSNAIRGCSPRQRGDGQSLTSLSIPDAYGFVAPAAVEAQHRSNQLPSGFDC